MRDVFLRYPLRRTANPVDSALNAPVVAVGSAAEKSRDLVVRGLVDGVKNGMVLIGETARSYDGYRRIPEPSFTSAARTIITKNLSFSRLATVFGDAKISASD